MANEYSTLKPLWWYVRDGNELPKAPKQVQFIISDLCNQNCHFCAYRMDGYTSNQMFAAGDLAAYGHNNPKRFIETDKALSLLGDFKEVGVSGIQFTGGGEPTVHPKHVSIFERTLALNMKASLVSNGYKWSDALSSLLPNFSWVRVSIDAGTSGTYAATRDTREGAFDTAWGNVDSLAALISVRRTRCVLGVGYVVTPDNFGEISAGVKRAYESGAAYIRLSAMFSPEGSKPYADIYPAIKHAIVSARSRYEGKDFTVHDLFGERLRDLDQGSPDYQTCAYQHYNTYVGGDLNVYRCCVLAYNKRGLLGSLRDRSYADFIRDPATLVKLTNFDARGCELCQFNDKNRAWNYVAGPPPTHVEFP